MAVPILGSSKEIESILPNVFAEYTERNPKSLASFDVSLSYMPGANTRATLHSQPFPITIARGESCKLFDVDGHEYVDFLGEYSAGVYGHSCQQIKTAITDALDKGWNFGGKNEYEAKLAQLLVTRFSYSIDLIRFCNSGTEANLMAIAAAINFTGKKKVLVFLNGYHGGVMMFFESNPKFTANISQDFVIAPYNDIAGTEALITELPPDSLAAILVEPVQVSGGCIVGDPKFLQGLREMATKQNALLIFDEVMTSRLGYGGIQKKLGIKPDMTTIGKWAGGGMSFGAFGGRADVMDMFDPRKGKIAHSGTFNNNVVTMAAGVAGCSILTEEALEKLNALGDKMRSQIAETIEKSLPVKEGVTRKIGVRGAGSLNTVYFEGPAGDSLQLLFYHYLLEHGIYIASRGFTALTIEIKEQHVTQLLEAVSGFIEKYKHELI